MANNKTSKPGWLFFLPWSLESVGGVNRVVIELCREMHNQGEYSPFVLIDSWEDTSPRIVDKGFYSEIHYRVREPLTQTNTVKATLLFFLLLPFDLVRLHRLFKKNSIRVLNPHFLTLNAMLLLIYRLVFGRSVRIFSSLHGADLLDIEASVSTRRIVYRFMLKRMDAVIACSNGLKNRVGALGVVPSQRLYAIPNGFSSDVFNSTSSSLADSCLPKTPYILSVATFEYKKGLDILVDAYSRMLVSGSLPELVLVGRSGPFLEKIRNQIEKLKIKHRVHIFTDVLPQEIGVFYHNAKLFVLPSRYEPFGIVLLEAAVNNIPVISTRTMGGEEIISDGENGLLVDRDDVSALLSAMESLISDPEKSAILSQALHDRVIKTYTWERACSAYVNLAQEMSPCKDI